MNNQVNEMIRFDVNDKNLVIFEMDCVLYWLNNEVLEELNEDNDNHDVNDIYVATCELHNTDHTNFGSLMNGLTSYMHILYTHLLVCPIFVNRYALSMIKRTISSVHENLETHHRNRSYVEQGTINPELLLVRIVRTTSLIKRQISQMLH